MNSAVTRVLADLRCALEELYGERLVRIVLYGSQARHDADPGSDIDVMIVLKGPVDAGREIARTGETTAAISLRHDLVVSCVFVSEMRYLEEQSPLLINVRREGVPA